MKILVTGANGMLATNTILYLLGKGYLVRGMLRDRQKLQINPSPRLEIVTGDLLDLPAVEKAVKGCSCVIHIAAFTAQDEFRYKSYEKVNVTGSLHLLAAAEKHRLKRFVFVSTANTIGHGTQKRPGREGMPPTPPFTQSLYARSKLAAEQELLKRARRTAVVIVNPSFILGPYDAKPGSGRILLMGLRRKLVFYPPGGKNFVNAKDVVKGIEAALRSGEHRAIYLLTGENLSYREFFEKLARVSGRRPRLIPIPSWLMSLAGTVGELLRRMGFRTPISRTNMKILSVSNFYTSQKAQRELGLRFRPIEQGIREALEWFEKEVIH